VCVLALCVAAFPVEAHDHGKADNLANARNKALFVATAKIGRKFSTIAVSKTGLAHPAHQQALGRRARERHRRTPRRKRTQGACSLIPHPGRAFLRKAGYFSPELCSRTSGF
jgi:hypothetical protein